MSQSRRRKRKKNTSVFDHGGFRRWIFAIQFLTTFPIRVNLPMKEEDYAASSVWFPFVGAVVGAVCVLFAQIANLAVANVVSASFAVLGNCVITGAFHIDGLADTFDASTHRSKKGRLRAMKNSRVEKRGTIAVVFDLLLRALFTYLILQSSDWVQALRMIVAVPICGRMSIVAAGMVSKSARPDGLGKAFIDGMGTREFLLASALAVSMLFLLCGALHMAVLYALSIAIGMMTAASISADLGGITGDTFGFVNEISELSALFALVIIKILSGTELSTMFSII